MFYSKFVCYFIVFASIKTITGEFDKYEVDKHRILVSIRVSDRDATVPFFLKLFEQLTYPKQKISLIIRSDYDVSRDVSKYLFKWLSKNQRNYHSVNINYKSKGTGVRNNPDNSEHHDKKLIAIREEALVTSRKMKVNYVWYLDTDVLLTKSDVLQKMISEDKLIVAPLLQSFGLFTNFWGDMTKSFWYKRSENYFDIIEYKTKECFPVAVVNSCFLVNVKPENKKKSKKSQRLSFEKKNLSKNLREEVPTVDTTIFSLVAQDNDVESFICNKDKYGYILQPADYTESTDYQQIAELGLDHILNTKEDYESYMAGLPLKPTSGLDMTSKIVQTSLNEQSSEDNKSSEDKNSSNAKEAYENIQFTENKESLEDKQDSEDIKSSENESLSEDARTPKKTLGFHKIYCINLARRPDRRAEMEKSFKDLNIDATIFRATDWKELNQTYLKSLNIREVELSNGKFSPAGEIANFISHYNIWKEVDEKKYKQVMVLEDDAEFHDNFKKVINELLEEIARVNLTWDFIYLGRKSLDKNEFPVYGSELLLKPSYSYWTVGYLLSLNGARKLIRYNPLSKITAVDEYIPVMYGRHKEKSWASQFPGRDLKAYALKNMIVEPSHYVGDDDYDTDAAYSPTLNNIV